MTHPYKTREGGATVTIFVPYDCKNHCPFCINKEEYADMTGFSLEEICRSIRRMDAITPRCDFVFTGGEPLSDLKALQIMRNKHKITCVNVSRHMQKYVVESNDGLLSRLPVRFRVNCVLYKDYPVKDLIPYLERFRKIPGASIQFRFDYTATTPENLYEEEHDKILQDLKQIARYTGLDGCRMRCGFHFDYQGMELTYHKTLPYSTVVETDPADGVTYDILYDILIKQNGDIHSDWTGVLLDVDAYEKVVYEPYDLRWLAKIA